ncbi:MAG: hypothetical protein BM562_18525 [Alphaproteobacteria bacterium MedPE-SWcel]|nr:MAG: hypothetical protein BM562_18525 [Alphaproteobacteria bacterium MedPE-SWcel]
MTTHDARQDCKLTGRKFFLDTNVWININGFDPRPEFRVYSDYYKSLLEANNAIVVSDLVVSEFHNRCCKTQHNICLGSGITTETSFKRFRVLPEAQEFMESVRDTCFNLIDDCEVDQLELGAFNLSDTIESCTAGRFDYNDLLILELCRLRGYILITHDRDYANCGIEVATANTRFLREAGA